MLKLPKIVGHRGACAYAPENTLESIKTAADMGCRFVEFDVRITRDSVPVLMHDDTLDRTTNGYGALADHTLADLNDLEAGSWFGGSFGGIKIPTLEETLDIIYGLNLGIMVDIRAPQGREVETTEAVLDILSRSWDDPERILITSYSTASLETALEMAPEWPRNLPMMDEWEHNWVEIAEHLQVSSITADTNSLLEKFRDLDTELPVIACVENNPDQARRLLNAGVACIMTDAPDIIAESVPRVH